MKHYLSLAVCAALICISSAAADDVVPLTRIRVIETQLPYDVEVLAADDSPDKDVAVISNTSSELILFFPSNEVLVRPLPPANGNNVYITYARFLRLLPYSNTAAAAPYNTSGGPTNVNSFSFTTNPQFPWLGTDGYLSFRVNPDCPNCK